MAGFEVLIVPLLREIAGFCRAMAGISVLKRLFSSEKHSQDQRKPPIKVCTSIPITDGGAILIGAHRPLRRAGDVVMVLFMRPGGRLSLSLPPPRLRTPTRLYRMTNPSIHTQRHCSFKDTLDP